MRSSTNETTFKKMRSQLRKLSDRRNLEESMENGGGGFYIG